MKKKGLLVVLNSYPTLSETFLYTALENLTGAGFDITICARRRGQAPHTPDFDVHYLPREDWWWPRRVATLIIGLFAYTLKSPGVAIRDVGGLVKSLRTQRQTWRQVFLSVYRILPLFRLSAEISYFAHGGLATTYLDYLTRKPSTLSLRGSDINVEPLLSNDHKEKLIQAIKAAKAVHCVCNAIKVKAEDLVGESLPKAQVIYTAVNPLFLATDRAACEVSSDRPIQIVSVGRLDWRKGFEHGLMAIRELCDRGVECHWQIIGEGSYRIPLEWAIRDMGLEQIVTLAGGQNQTAVRDLLLEADIYFHPAVREGLSNAVLEAMATGLPIVVSDVGGMREAVSDGIHGYLVPPRDWRAMADALEKLSVAATARAEIGREGAKHIRTVFSLERQRAEFLEFFQQAPE